MGRLVYFRWQVLGVRSQAIRLWLEIRGTVDDREQSRKEWEKEIVDLQRGVTFDAGLRRAQIITRKLSAIPAPIPDFAHLVRLLLSGILLVIGFVVFSSDIRHKVALGVAALAASCCLGVAAFRWPRKHDWLLCLS